MRTRTQTRAARTPGRPSRRPIAGALGLLAALAASDAAADSYKLRFDQSLSLANNATLSGQGGSVSSITDISGTYSTSRKGVALNFTGGLNARLYAGDTNQENDIFPRAGVQAIVNSKRVTLSATGNINARPTSESQEDDTGLTSNDVIQVDMSGALQATVAMGEADTLSMGVSLRRTEFLNSVGVLSPSLAASMNGSWSRRFSESLSGGFSTSLSYNRTENSADSESIRLTFGPNARRQLTKTSTGAANLGLTIAQASDNTSTGDLNVGVNVGLSYQLDGERDSLSFSAGQAVEPTSLGELQNRTTLAANYNRRLNSTSSFAIASRAVYQAPFEGSGDDSLFLSVSPSLSFQLARQLEGRISYELRLRDSASGAETSNRLRFSLARTYESGR